MYQAGWGIRQVICILFTSYGAKPNGVHVFIMDNDVATLSTWVMDAVNL